MSGLELDADGFVDMDQFPDDGTDLVGADLDELRATLHADPVDEPTPEQWDAILDDVVGADLGAGPFAVDDADVPADGDGDVTSDDLDPDLDADVTSDDLDPDLDVDGGLDLSTDDTLDDAYAPDAVGDGAPDVSPDFEDLL